MGRLPAGNDDETKNRPVGMVRRRRPCRVFIEDVSTPTDDDLESDDSFFSLSDMDEACHEQDAERDESSHGDHRRVYDAEIYQPGSSSLERC